MRYCYFCKKPMHSSNHSIWISRKNYDAHAKCIELEEGYNELSEEDKQNLLKQVKGIKDGSIKTMNFEEMLKNIEKENNSRQDNSETHQSSELADNQKEGVKKMKLPKKKYNTIVIDPAWEISLTGGVKRREKRANKLPYKTMTLEEIKKIPIGNIANKGCHVYCWTTNKMLKQTFDVLEAWGVNFHLVMPMVKPSGIAPCMGYVFASEFCLLGFYGKPMQKFKKAGKLNWIKCFNKAGTHSSKPEEFYDLVKEMSPFPRIDIFGRKKHLGFEPFGDEAPIFYCPKCEKKLDGSDLEDYEWLCRNCDENFYHIEVLENIIIAENKLKEGEKEK